MWNKIFHQVNTINKIKTRWRLRKMTWRLWGMTKTVPFEILAFCCNQEAGQSKCQTEGDIARVGKQEIKYMLREITNQMGKRQRTNSWLLKRRICRVNGNHRKRRTKGQFWEGGKRKYKVDYKEWQVSYDWSHWQVINYLESNYCGIAR